MHDKRDSEHPLGLGHVTVSGLCKAGVQLEFAENVVSTLVSTDKTYLLFLKCHGSFSEPPSPGVVSGTVLVVFVYLCLQQILYEQWKII